MWEDNRGALLRTHFFSYKHAFYKLYASQDVSVVYCDVLSAVWTLILTAPIHCRGSIGEQVI